MTNTMNQGCGHCSATANWLVWDTTTTPYTEIPMCDDHANEAEAKGWPYQQLKTEGQYDALIAWKADGAGTN